MQQKWKKSKNKKYLLFNEKKQLKNMSTYLSQHYPRKPYAHIIPDFLFENNPIPYQSFKARFWKKKDKILTTLTHSVYTKSAKLRVNHINMV